MDKENKLAMLMNKCNLLAGAVGPQRRWGSVGLGKSFGLREEMLGGHEEGIDGFNKKRSGLCEFMMFNY